MADNTSVKDASDLTVTIATDEIGSVHFQKVRLDLGDDTNASTVSGAVPVSGTFWPTTQPVSATDLDIRNLAAATDTVAVSGVVPGTGATNLGKAEDSQHASGDVGVMMLGVRNEGNEDFSGSDGDYLPVAVDAKGHLMVRSGDGALSVSVVLTDPPNNDGEAGANALPVESYGMLYNGTTWDRVRGDVTNGLDVDVTRIGGTVTLSAETTKVIGTVNVAAAQSIGVTGTFWQATQPVSLPAATLAAATGTALVSGVATATTTGDTSVIAAPGSGWFLYITTLIVHNSSATATSVSIKDGSTAKLTIPAPATSGAVVSLPAPLRLSDNAALQFASAAGVTTMSVSAVGYKAQA